MEEINPFRPPWSVKAAVIASLLTVFGTYVYVCYFRENPTQSETILREKDKPSTAESEIRYQQGIQSLVCDIENDQHYNYDECMKSLDLEYKLNNPEN